MLIATDQDLRFSMPVRNDNLVNLEYSTYSTFPGTYEERHFFNTIDGLQPCNSVVHENYHF